MAKFKVNLKKIDFTPVKKFLLAKGEKVVLVAALVLGAFLVFNGLLAAKNSGRNKDGEDMILALRDGAQRLQNQMAAAQAVDSLASGSYDPETIKWLAVASTFPFNPLMSLSESGDFKRRNPAIVEVPGNTPNRSNIQSDYIAGAAKAYEVDRDKQMVLALVPPGAPKNTIGAPAVSVRSTRLIVTYALFPMRQQLLEFSKALRVPLGELARTKEDLPVFLGLNVIRVETDAQGKTVETKLYWANPKSDKIQVHEPIENFLREAIIDTEGLKAFENYRWQNLMTPLPIFANADFPPLRLDGLTVKIAEAPDDDKGKPEIKKPPQSIFGKGPDKGPAPLPPPQGDLKSTFWKKLDKAYDELVARFGGNFAVFNPLAGPPSDDKKTIPNLPVVPQFPMPLVQPGQDPGKPPRPVEGGFQPPPVKQANVGEPAAAAPEAPINDALIRFIDVDVEPGKTYHYKFQVRLLNPNYKMPADRLATQGLRDIKELPPPGWTTTPPVTVPHELFMFAVDQTEPHPTSPKKTIGRPPDQGNLEEQNIVVRAPVQIHRWFGKATDPSGGSDYLVADWAVAERLLVRRGEFIGRSKVIVEVPTWNKFRGDWEVLDKTPTKKTAAKETPIKGIPLDFTLGDPAPLLVDFEGGPKVAKSGKEDAAMELLILTPDGRLVVRNSGEDTDDAKRIERYDAYRQRLSHPAPAGNKAAPPVGGGRGGGG